MGAQRDEDFVLGRAFQDILFQQSPVAQVVMDPESGRFIACNQAAARAYGFKSPGEMLGMRPLDLSPKYQADGRPSRHLVLDPGKVVEAKGSHRFFWRHQKPDGSYWDAEVHLMVFQQEGRDLLLYTVLDVSDRIAAQKAARASENRFRRLFESAGDAQLLLEGNRFVECNRATVEVLGFTNKEQVLNTHPSSLSPPLQPDGRNSAEKAEAMIGLALENGSHRFEWTHLKADGTPLPVEVMLTTISEPGGKLIHTAWRDLTVREKARQELQAANRRLNDIIDFLPDATFVINRQGRVEAWNKAMEEMTGITAGDILGKGDHAYSVPFWGDRRPIMIDLVMDWDENKSKHYRFVRQEGDTLLSESDIPGLKPGGAFLFNTARALRNEAGEVVGAIESVRDVTDYRKAQMALVDSEKRLNQVIDFLPDAAFVVDERGRVQLWNRAMEKLTGIKAADMVGKGDFEYALPFYGERRPILVNMALDWDPGYESRYLSIKKVAEGVLLSESHHPNLHGGVFLAAMARVIFDNQGNKSGAIETLRDITDAKQVQAQLEKARRAAEEASQAKSDFLANMSHEIRTPMNAVIGLSHLALKTELTPKQRDYLEKISYSGHALLGIINDILDFSKIEAGKLEVENIPFNLEEVLGSVSDLLGLRAQEKELELLFHIDPQAPHALKGDPLRLGQVLVNLTNNAIKFTENGEIVISAALRGRHGSQCRIGFQVKDTGIGMSEAQQAKLFRAFSQADTSTTRKYGGTGLGLAISKSLVELMGGELEVSSQKGEGSVFSFELAMEQVGREETARARLPEDLRGLKVLVVDDNASSRLILQHMLESMSFRVTLAASAREGLEELRSSDKEDPFDLVFMDWKMPGVDGLKATEMIRSSGDLTSLPTVIMVSAYGREEVMHRARALGLEAFLIKPVNESILLDSVMDAFGRKGSARKEAAVAPALEQAESSVAGARVLLVEDNAINQQVAEEILGAGGLLVEVAANGRLAVEAVEGRDYDAVLMDLQMPEMDGYQATRAIRGLPQKEGLPIIAMTAHAMTKDRDRCLASGMNDYVSKPIDPRKLMEVLEKWIAPGPREPAACRSSREPARALELPERLPGLDLSDGLARVGGNGRLYAKVLAELFEDYQDGGQRLAQAIEQGGLEEARRLAHTLKGVGGNLAAKRLARAAKSLEEKLEGPEASPAPSCLDEFRAALAEVLASAEKVRLILHEDRARHGNEEVEALSAGELEALLAKLASAIESFDPAAAEDLAFALPRLPDPAREPGRLLQEHLEAFDFAEASGALASLARVLNLPLPGEVL